MFAAGGVGPDTAAMFDELERIGLAAVRERGEATTAELTALDRPVIDVLDPTARPAPASPWVRDLLASLPATLLVSA